MVVSATAATAYAPIVQFFQPRATRMTRAEENRDIISLSQETRKLTADIRLVRRIKSQIDNVSTVRQEKVAALKARVESGDFNVSSSEVADKILSRYFG